MGDLRFRVQKAADRTCMRPDVSRSRWVECGDGGDGGDQPTSLEHGTGETYHEYKFEYYMIHGLNFFITANNYIFLLIPLNQYFLRLIHWRSPEDHFRLRIWAISIPIYLITVASPEMPPATARECRQVEVGRVSSGKLLALLIQMSESGEFVWAWLSLKIAGFSKWSSPGVTQAWFLSQPS